MEKGPEGNWLVSGPSCRHQGEELAYHAGERDRRGSLRGLVQIRPQGFARNACNALYIAHTFGGDALPLVNCLAGNAEGSGEASRASCAL